MDLFFEKFDLGLGLRVTAGFPPLASLKDFGMKGVDGD